MTIDNHYAAARFELSANQLHQMPADTGREVAFAGRSNTGKSSVINVLTRQRGLARVSKTPGRTQLLNCFSLSEDRRLIDLPGYGYAKVPEAMQQHWGEVMQQYFASRESLQGLVLVVDIRHGLKPFDLQMVQWCEADDLPLHILLNKADKLSRGAGLNLLNQVRAQLHNSVSLQTFSALQRTGLPDLIQQLDRWFDWQQVDGGD